MHAANATDPVTGLRRRQVDALVAGALAVWGLLETFLVDGPGSTVTRVAFALGFTVPLLWRRRFAVPVLAFISALLVLRALTADAQEFGTAPFPSLLVATFSVACYVRPLAVAAPAALMPVAAMMLTVPTDYWSGDQTPGDVAILCFFVAAAWAAGRLVRRRSQQIEAARAEGGERAREAVAAERARIARELHDVVAHSVSIIAVQAGAAEALVERDPPRARAPGYGAPHRPRGAHRDAPAARRAARGRGPLRAPADAGRSRPAGGGGARGGRAGGAGARRGRAGPPRRDRPGRVPDRAGGADQRPPPRRRRPDPGGRAPGRRCGRGRGGQRGGDRAGRGAGRRPRDPGHARAGAPVRRLARGRARGGRRFAVRARLPVEESA